MNKPKSKLLKFKQWLTLAEAAKHLSVDCGEDVTEADILQYALNGHLTLSVIIDSPTWAHECEIVTYDLDKLNAEIAGGIYSEKLLWRKWNGGVERASPCLGGNKFLNVYDRFTSLKGIYDLPFFGDAWITVENKLWELIGNKKTYSRPWSGIYLEDGNGNIYRLKDSYKLTDGANIYKLKNVKKRDPKCHIADHDIPNILAEERKIFTYTNRNTELPNGGNCLVVRLNALESFEQLLSDDENDTVPANEVGKPTTSQRNGYYKEIIVKAIAEFTDICGYPPKTVEEVIQRLKNSPPIGHQIDFLPDKKIKIDNSSIEKPLTDLERAINRELKR